MLYIFIILAFLIIDRITKLVIINNMQMGDSHSIINNFFNITYWENKGAAWGIFQNGRWFFIALTVVVSIILIILLLRSKDKVFSVALSLLISGAFGNLIDRIFRGSVTDFLDFKIFRYDFPIFNVADICVVVGTFIFAYYLIFIYEEKVKE